MPTVLDKPETRLQEKLTRPPRERRAVVLETRVIEAHPLFADSLLDSSSSDRKRRGFATSFSFIFECVIVGFLVIVPLLFTDALPTAQIITMLVAPPPPPPPPPPSDEPPPDSE